eukprot:5236484-Amphidinium_carterae.1
MEMQQQEVTCSCYDGGYTHMIVRHLAPHSRPAVRQRHIGFAVANDHRVSGAQDLYIFPKKTNAGC